MRALVRYVGADALRSQRWLAPLLTYLALLAVVDATTGPVRSTYATSAALLVPIATWVTIVVNQSEDPVQTWITVVNAGSDTRVRLAKLVTAGLGCLALGVAATVGPLLSTSHPWSTSDLGIGVLAHALCGGLGVALGALCSRPVLRRTAWSVLAAAALSLAAVLIPNCPPARQLLDLLESAHPSHLGASLALTSLENVALCAALVAGAVAIAQRRD
jgi:hypothetical protein